MKMIMGVFLTMLTVVGMSSSYAADVSEASVRALIAQLGKASHARDVDTIARLTSANFSCSATLTNNAGKQAYQWNRTEYLEDLKAGWELMDEYSYELKNVKIQLSGGKATYTADEVERLRIGNNRITIKTKMSGTIESIHGNLQFTRMNGDSVVQTVT